jgi:predicted MPP superfamily phosphohydrolase
VSTLIFTAVVLAGASAWVLGHLYLYRRLARDTSRRRWVRLLAGLHRHDATTQIYVSRGTGYWGPPMRMWAPAEISQIVLTT